MTTTATDEPPIPLDELIKHRAGTATTPQRNLLIKLTTTRNCDPGWLDQFRRHIEGRGLAKAYATTAIDWLLKRPTLDGSDPLAATERQRGTIESMMLGREVPEHYAAMVRSALSPLSSPLTKKQASEMIETLGSFPAKPQQLDPDEPQVPDGRYALNPDDPERYKVTHWRNGKVYVDHIGPNERTTKITGERRREVLKAIAADLVGAATLYGRVTNRCYRCHQLLTRPDSVERGMGKDCAAYLAGGQ